MASTMMNRLQKKVNGQSSVGWSRAHSSRRHLVVRASVDRHRMSVNAALATRAPPSYIFEPIDWISTLQAIVLPPPKAATQRIPAEEECPWASMDFEQSHRSHSMYVSHLANRMAMEPASSSMKNSGEDWH